MYAEVVVNLPQLEKAFHYHVPPELQGRLGAGHLVTVPFGSRRVQGIVAGFVEEPDVPDTKPVEALVDPEPVLTRQQLDLAYWLSHHYLAPLIDCLTLMLPPGLSRKADIRYTLTDPEARADTPAQAALIGLLARRGPLRGRQLDRALSRAHWPAPAEALLRRGVLARESVLDPPSVRPKTVRTVRLAVPPPEAEAARPRLQRSETPAGAAKAARLAGVLDFLIMEGEPVDVAWAYAQTGCNLADLRQLAEEGLVDLGAAEVWRDPLAEATFAPASPPQLTPDQEEAWGAIRAGMARLAAGESVEPFLLHGVTGSGKTEIYLRAVEQALAEKRQAIVLVPEIALTPQTVRRFAARFPGRVAVVHSQLSEGERYDTWRRARAGLFDVAIGPRSALFLPLPAIGLVVLDEEHDEAYKQDAPVARPYYHAREAAVEYARRLGAACILGSASPDLVSYYRAERGTYRRLPLSRRIMGHRRQVEEQARRQGVSARYRPSGAGDAVYMDLPPVQVVDMRQELRAGNTSMFSRALQQTLGEGLARNEQAILFLNRRGTATYVFCRDCGHVLRCTRCDVPFTYHGAAGALVCHQCNARRRPPRRCPGCESDRIRHFGAGTQRVEEEVQRRFPGARTLRWDRDVTRQKGAHEAILSQFAARQADVLIGTQMIAKGLDLPLVTLVGVVSADVGLALPDYRAAERTFQTLMQVAGRAGRGLLGGQVVLQSYAPEHYAIQAAAAHDYEGFYQHEMDFRRELGYPPFRRLVRLTYRHHRADQAESEAEVVARQLRLRIEHEDRGSTELVGPAPCFFARVAGQFRWQILLRGPDPAGLVRGREPAGWQVEVDPLSTL